MVIQTKSNFGKSLFLCVIMGITRKMHKAHEVEITSPTLTLSCGDVGNCSRQVTDISVITAV